MLWVDKHRPTTLDKCDYHTELCERLLELASKTDIPHMMFYGPSGAGKKTRVMGFLRAVFGSGVEKLKLEHRSVKTPSRRTVEITTVASSYHIEMNPGDAGMYDRFIVQEVIKEIASSRNLDSKHAFKVVVLTEADQLTRDAQAALRRTMEKHSATCRLILLCNNPSKVIDPVRSRCLGIRVPAPSVKDMMDVMTGVAGKEGLTLPRQMAVLVANKSGRNMRRALLMLEASKVQNYPFKPDQQIAVMDWEQCIAGIAVDVRH
ncbi:RFC3, partial [Symbiodinium sp. KB8]